MDSKMEYQKIDSIDKEEKEPILQKPSAEPAAVPVAQVTNTTGAPVQEKWSSGLWECCAKPGGGALGCVSIFMPFVQYGVLAEQLPKEAAPCAGAFCGAATTFLALDVLASLAQCSLWPGVSLVPTSALFHMQMRSHLRRKYNIEGNWFTDLCTAWWCGPCALAQETREVVIRASREHAAQVAAAGGALAAPMPHMVGYMVAPPQAYTPAAGAASAAAPPSTPMCAPAPAMTMAPAVQQPATGIPVNHVPPTHVATVKLN